MVSVSVTSCTFFPKRTRTEIQDTPSFFLLLPSSSLVGIGRHHCRFAVVFTMMHCTASSLLRRFTSPMNQKRHIGLVPVVLEQSALGERSFDIYSRLLRERIICVHGEVTDQMASVVTAQLLFLEAEAPEKPLYMYINSPGGLVTAGMAIYDTMQYVSPQVHTICMGQAASMGSLLLAGGAPEYRFSLYVYREIMVGCNEFFCLSDD